MHTLYRCLEPQLVISVACTFGLLKGIYELSSSASWTDHAAINTLQLGIWPSENFICLHLISASILSHEEAECH